MRSASYSFQKGECYYYGTGVATDKTTAVRYYKLAADQGFAAAQFYMGKTMCIGQFVCTQRKVFYICY